MEIFVLLYLEKYEQEWILDNVYSYYINGNEQEFQGAYHRYGRDNKAPYEAYSLEFVPYKEGGYCIFDKQRKEFSGIFSLTEL